MPQAKTEVALQFLECCAAEVALQLWLFCSADVILTKSCAAASEKLQCNIEKAALQESGAFLPLSCGLQAPTFRHPRLGPAEPGCASAPRRSWLVNVAVLLRVIHGGTFGGIFAGNSCARGTFRGNSQQLSDPKQFGKFGTLVALRGLNKHPRLQEAQGPVLMTLSPLSENCKRLLLRRLRSAKLRL